MGINLTLAISIVLVLITIALGLMLHKSGMPYNKVWLALHKFATIGLIVFMSVILINVSRNSGVEALPIITVILSVISVLLLMGSGALLSLDKWHISMLWIHRFATLALIISLGIIYYSIFAAIV